MQQAAKEQKAKPKAMDKGAAASQVATSAKPGGAISEQPSMKSGTSSRSKERRMCLRPRMYVSDEDEDRLGLGEHNAHGDIYPAYG